MAEELDHKEFNDVDSYLINNEPTDPKQSTTKPPSKKIELTGILCCLLASLILPLMGICVQFGTKWGYSAFELIFARSIDQLIISFTINQCQNAIVHCKQKNKPKSKSLSAPLLSDSDEKHNITDNTENNPKSCIPCIPYIPLISWFYLCLRGLTGATVSCFHFKGFELIPLGDGNATFATSVIWTTIWSRLILKEKWGYSRLFALILGVGGIVFLSQPDFLGFPVKNGQYGNESETNILDGYIFCVLGGFVNSWSFIILQKLKKIPAYMVIYFYGLGQMIVSCIVNSIIGNWIGICPGANEICYKNVLILICVGITGGMGQYFMTIGVAKTSAQIASLIVFTSLILFSFVYQVLFFRQYPNMFAVIGGISVIVSIFFVYFQQAFQTFREKRRYTVEKEYIVPKTNVGNLQL
eukprot:480198_1